MMILIRYLAAFPFVMLGLGFLALGSLIGGRRVDKVLGEAMEKSYWEAVYWQAFQRKNP